MHKCLVLDQSVALLDTSLLDKIADPLSPLKIGKKESLKRKDETICNYYVINTNSLFIDAPTWQHKRVNEMCNAAQAKGYQYLVIINC